MARYLSYILFSFVVLSCISVVAISSSLPPSDLPLDKRAGKTVVLFDIPVRASVEDYVLENNISADLIRSLYYKIIAEAESNKTFYGKYEKLLAGEEHGLTMHISKKTKEITDVEIFMENDD